MGQRFGRLKAYLPDDSKQRKWICVCDCGSIHMVATSSLTSGRSTSCGCFRREKVTAENTSHGMYGSPTYVSWTAMLTRCDNPNRKVWKYYGGRGVRIDPRWRSFENFLADMGERPTGLTLERVDSNLGYSRSNCSWATPLEQALSRRNTRWVVFDGRRMPMSHWAAELGYSWSCLRDRIARLPLDQALQPKGTQ